VKRWSGDRDERIVRRVSKVFGYIKSTMSAAKRLQNFSG
jgi:hypothetical protein